jgi:serine phosphatase RsbU (regulator of sigma subunit)
MTNTNAAQPSGDRLALLYRLSQTFSSSLDLDEVLNRVMDEVIAATRAERGFTMLREPDGDLTFRAARGMDHETIDDPQFQVSRSVVERVAREGQPVLTSDAQTDDRFSMRLSVVSLGLRSILCVPLKTKDRITGVIYVDNRLHVGIFGAPDLELLTSIASSASISIENARLYQLAVEKGRLERELQVAREVQASLLPRETPLITGWEFAARWRPARQVSGDFYDFLPLDDGQLGLVLGDVSDKGMPAALFMALTRSIVRASLGHAPSPADGIARANRLICADSSGGMFVTLFCALLNPETGEFTYVNAGHNPPLLCQAGGGAECAQPVKLMPTGMALGVLDDAPFEQRTVVLSPGDFTLLYTDGVTDAMSPTEQAFGIERLERTILEHRHASASDLLDALESRLDEHTRASAQFDDIAVMIAKRLQ